MKKITLLLLVFCISMLAIAQSKYTRLPVKASPARAIKDQRVAAQPVNPFANSKSVMETTIGDSEYDMQTNGSIGPRLKVYPDGTMAGVWIRGFESAGRGTGYNYFDGTAWGQVPTSRIENDRTGWPSYAQLGATGEIVVAHLNDGLKISTRDIKGQGTWTQSVLMGPAGATDLSWPRMITSGVNHNYIHLLATTYIGEFYMGLDYALLYYRSLNGGQTWDKSAVVLPQMDSTLYDGFNGDEYEWGTPHGDTIYFAVSGPWIDTFIMKSNDNGETWTKIPVLSNAYKKLPAGTIDVPPFTMSDGSVTCEMDHSGVIHMAFGIGGGYMTSVGKYIYSNLNGLVYWNTTMPMVKDSLDLDTLAAHGQLLGLVTESAGDTITNAPSYRVGLSSFPQISIDASDNKYFLWSAVAPGNPSPDLLNYRHITGRAWFSGKPAWGDMIDFNAGVLYLFTEFVYPCMAKNIRNDKLSVIYQTSTQPGSNIATTGTANVIPLHQVNIDYREISGSSFWPVAVETHSGISSNLVYQNYPNPVKDYTHIRITLTASCEVTINVSNIAGVTMMEISKGLVVAGNHDFTLDASRMAPGIYFYTVTMGSEKITRKMIVQ